MHSKKNVRDFKILDNWFVRSGKTKKEKSSDVPKIQKREKVQKNKNYRETQKSEKIKNEFDKNLI